MKQCGFRSIVVMALLIMTVCSCAGTSTQVRKVTKPIDETAESLVKIRELKTESGETRAVVSPADERQVRIPF